MNILIWGVRITKDGNREPEFHARINLLTSNVNYSSRTAQLTSKVSFCIFIQQI